MKNIFSKNAFTLMEILITVIIIGIIAAFAIPNYGKTVANTRLQDAIMQLSAIRSANQIYYARTSTYWPQSTSSFNVDAINTALNLSIIPNQLTYSCAGIATGQTFTCTAITTDTNPFTVTVTQAELSATNPQCTAGSCPSH